MIIKAIEARKLVLPWPKRTKTSFGTYTEMTSVLVKVTSESGVVGYGEAGLMPRHLGEGPDVAVSLVNDQFAPAIVGLDALDNNEIHRRLDSIVNQAHATKSAVDIALYDLVGRTLCVPVYKLLGGLVQPSFGTATGLSFGTPEEMVAALHKQVALGFRSFEVKMSGDADEDILRIKALTENADPDIVFMFDPNEGWTVSDAIRVGRSVADAPGRIYFEQPVHRSLLSGMAQVRRATGVPIIAHEPIVSPQAAFEVIDREAADIINVTPTRIGSFKRCLDVIALAKAAGLDYRIDAPLQTEVANTAAAHLAVATDHILAAVETHLHLTERVSASGGLQIDRGVVTVSDGHGLGLDMSAEYR